MKTLTITSIVLTIACLTISILEHNWLALTGFASCLLYEWAYLTKSDDEGQYRS